MFDITQDTFTVKIISGTDKICTLSYPKDKDWCARVRAQQTTRNNLGRGAATYDISPTHDLDAALLASLRLDKDGPAFDGDESTAIIDKLDRADKVSVEREGNAYRVKIKVYGGSKVTHVLRIPSQKAINAFGAASAGKARFSGSTVQTRSFLEPSGELYDALFVSTEGYGGESSDLRVLVPINHKAAALAYMLNAISEAQAEDEADPEE